MEDNISAKAKKILFLNTLAFTICFSAWMMNGVLVAYLTDNHVYEWSSVQIGWLLGLPVLTGSIFRLPLGLLTDKFGGRIVFSSLMFISAIPMFLISLSNSYLIFLLCSLGFGLTGASFAVGVAYTSLWYPSRLQGTALGIFGLGNLGASLTTFLGPSILQYITDNSNNIENWRLLPVFYSVLLFLMALTFFFFTENKKPDHSEKKLITLLQPLKNIRVWRFGLYYFLVFGCFVAFSQWLVQYYLNVYYLSFVKAGLLAGLFSFTASIIRIVGGWLSDKYGPRKVLYSVFISSAALGLLLSFPRMELYSPGKGVISKNSGIVTEINDRAIKINDKEYSIKTLDKDNSLKDDCIIIFPQKSSWQEPVVKTGEVVKKNQLIAKGITKINFQANLNIFALFVLLIAIAWGLGMGAVYKFIPMYFPNSVGVVGGTVGVLGGLGGFFGPILFGYLLEFTGLWTSSWMFTFMLSLICFVWMQIIINKINNKN